MLCENCGDADAVVHLTRVKNDAMTKVHLCQNCAAETGVQADTPPVASPLADFLAQMGQGAPGAEVEQAGEPCGFCGLTLAGFRESGRLGCPHCYTTFDSHLRGLLRRVHGGTQHVGKVYLMPEPSEGEVARRLERLREKLNRAVECEDFERAAAIRDQINSVEAS